MNTGITVRRPRGAYGIDAPYVPASLAVGALITGALASTAGAHSFAGGALVLGASAASYLYTTRAGKFRVWSDLLDELALRGDERVLDVGCGRGAVLIAVAARLPDGRAVGVDVWRSRDQSGNTGAATLRNATLAGVAERVALRTGDMRALPLADAAFDVVLSSLAIHNLPDAAARSRALDEMVRVLRPGGRIVLADFRHAAEYATRLGALGLTDVTVRRAGWRFWYGGPWAATTIVRARKPLV